MQTRALRSLVKISTVGSFAKAADQLNMTLPALSMQMKALESELAVELFDRSVRPPRLTPIGRSVVHEAAALLQTEDSLIELCRPSDSLVGRFRLGFITTAAVRLLPGFLDNAQKNAPHATFEFETGLSRTLQNRVLAGQIDAAVLTDADGLPNELLATVIREEPFVFAAHSTLMADGMRGLLAKHPFFHFMPDTGIGKLIANEMARHDRQTAANTVVLDNLEAIMECVTNGLGFTLLPEPDVDRYRTGSVQKIPLPKPLRRVLVLATLRQGALSSRTDTLASLLDSTHLYNAHTSR
ncbi:LysR family transcriptional regulator [uncultured Tateyamaria sp.]|uniref:LysR family transcriptional regulator n=1 Tax=uncultured Tateyamaria sp. TaxID=455651 RepID=UPI00260FFE7A|nr:LysR family transcriptional regulator [uncultured Tateyamaria sp.]